MAEITINNSPVHSQSILTAVYGETGESWARFHTGIDFAPYGDTPANPILYSVCNGIVNNILFDNTLGNQVVIEDSETGYFWRYCHLENRSNLSIGDNVDINTEIGIMGATGNVTGIHLHLELSTTSYWDYDTFLNPSDALGIPNARGTIINFNEEIPIKILKKKNFPWAILTKKIRHRRNTF